MGKKGGKNDKEAKAAKKEAKQAKQAAKASKSATKKARKTGALDSDEEDIETIMQQLAAADAKRVAVTVEVVPQPSARVNFSLSALSSGELVMFGGEFFNGQVNTCYNELYRFEPGKGGGNNNSSSSTSSAAGGGGAASAATTSAGAGTWRAVISPNTPGHRCSHQAVVHNNTSLILFGGEFATANQFYHYGDTWRLDLGTNRWGKIECKKSPSPRSGHRMVSWRNYVVLYGGFYQTLTHDKWYGDVWLFDTRGAGSWAEVTFPVTASLPAARSGTQLVLLPNKDAAIIYGGYSEVRAGQDRDSIIMNSSKQGAGGGGGKGGPGGGGGAASLLFKKTRSVVHTDMWILRLGPILTQGTNGAHGQPTWERVRTVGIPPSPRVGFAMAMWKDRILLFGGVQDKEGAAAAEGGAEGGGGKASVAASLIAPGSSKDIVRSTFFNDLYSFDLGRRRWYKLELRVKKSGSGGGEGGEGGSRRRKARGKGGAAAAAAAGGGGGKIGGKKNKGDEDDDEEEEGAEYDEDELDEDEDEEAALEAAAAAKARGGGGGGRGGGVEDTAFYYYQDGKLVRVEDDGEGEDGEDKADTEAAKEDGVEGSGASAATGGGKGRSGSAAASSSSTASSGPASSPSPAAVSAAQASKSKESEAAAKAAAAAAANAAAIAVLPQPAGRIRTGAWVEGHWLYVYGGLREEQQEKAAAGGSKAEGLQEREVTLDDMWRIDLKERNGWECLLQGHMHEQDWKGEEDSDDDDEEDEEDEEEEEEEEDEESNDEDEDEDDDEEDGEEGEARGGDDDGVDGTARGLSRVKLGSSSSSAAAAAAGAAGAGGGSRFARSQVRMTKEAARARELRDKLGLEDASVTPAPGESLGQFFARTCDSWTARYLASGEIKEGVKVAGKDVRRAAFAIARARYEAVWPLLAELHEIEEAQRAIEEEAAAEAAAKAAKKGKKGGKGGKR